MAGPDGGPNLEPTRVPLWDLHGASNPAWNLAFGDADGLGFDTVYVRILGSGDPADHGSAYIQQTYTRLAGTLL